MPQPEVRCFYCGELIPSSRGAHARVTGWEKARKAGGTNALRVRERTGEWAHDRCVDMKSRGHDPLQRQLFD